jgi:transposase
MGKRGPKAYSDDFRREAVRLVRESGRTRPEVAAELGISAEALRVWERQFGPAEMTKGRGRVLALEEENRRLRRENERLQEEREILKKATAFFAKGAR